MHLKKFNLKNKTALVTKAGKGIGRTCAITLTEAATNFPEHFTKVLKKIWNI